MSTLMSVQHAIDEFLADCEDDVCDGTLLLYRSRLTMWQTWRTQRGYGPLLADVTKTELKTFFHYLEHEHIPHITNPHRPPSPRRVFLPQHGRVSGVF